VPSLLTEVDNDGLLEYSVVYTDRALNHMSQSFQVVMKDISSILKQVYNAKATIVVPGSGTFGMEAVARQFATGKKCLVLRNGWFSYRWTQIFEMGNIPSASTVLKARRMEDGKQAAFAPAPIEEVVARIHEEKPDVVFAPHVETASGTLWVDMQATGVDVLISAPQKGWSASPCCGLVMLSDLALQKIETTTSTSFACDLRKWLQIMAAYENGGFAYHATMPTDSLRLLRDVMKETQAYGFDKVRLEQQELGVRVRALFAGKGFKSVAAEGFQAPGVVVCYTEDAEIQSGKKFLAEGLQIAAGVPLQCDEPADFKTFRIGLFGLEKLHDIDRTVGHLERALGKLQ